MLFFIHKIEPRSKIKKIKNFENKRGGVSIPQKGEGWVYCV